MKSFYLDELDKIKDEDLEPHEAFTIKSKLRKKKEIQDMANQFFDLVWYYRSVNWDIKYKSGEQKFAAMAQCDIIKNLLAESIPTNELEYNRAEGWMACLRWVLSLNDATDDNIYET